MKRITGIAFGLATQALFLGTVYQLVRFLEGIPIGSRQGRLWIDVLLALQFAVLHSLLLLPSTRRAVTRRLSGAFYGCLFCVVTCTSLFGMFGLWRQSSVSLWHLEGTAAICMQGAFAAAWVGLVYSLHLTGLGYQTGWTPWWDWFRGRPARRRTFQPRSLYRWLRHPVYLSFLGLIWFTPAMTGDRMILALIWTPYIFIGSYLKDERLAFYVGAAYRVYASKVPGYPLMPSPLGRRLQPPRSAAAAVGAASAARVASAESTPCRQAA